MSDTPADTVRGPRVRVMALGRAMVGWVNLPGVITMVVLLVVWQLLIDTGIVVAQYIVAPTEIASSLSDLLGSGKLQDDTVHTLKAVTAGWGIAMVLGVTFGTILGLFARARTYSMATVDLLRSLPMIAIIPPAVLVFGFSLKMEIWVIVYAAIWPIVINTAGGIASAPRELHSVAQTFHLGPVRTAASVIIPAAMPTIIVGARLGMSVAVILAVIAEMVGNPAGLGFAMVFAQQAIQPAQMFAYIVTIGLLGVALNFILVSLSYLIPSVAADRAARRGR